MNDSKSEKVITVGRASSCNIVINNQNVSSSHAKFIISDNTITLVDTDSTNGTYVDGERITSKIVTKDNRITFSKNFVFDWNKLEPFIKLSTGEVPVQSDERLKTRIVQEKNVINIGRTKDNDLVINNIKVSRTHARLEKKGEEWFLEDLDSSNGTFINGKRIKRECVTPYDVITIGGVPLNLERLFSDKKEISGDIQIAADNLTFRVKDKLIVDNIGLTILPGEFVGLIGPSGAGKTTLMMMMNGVIKPSEGDVLINDQSLYTNFDSFKGQIGYVPQDDIIHRELKVQESFHYTGRLRLDNNTNEEITSQVDNILNTLGLEETRDTLIGSAEKKRNKRRTEETCKPWAGTAYRTLCIIP